MLSIQEIVNKTEKQRKQIRETMDSWGEFHPSMKTPEQTYASIYDGLSYADQLQIKESLHKIPLHEFLAKSGTSGIAGAVYLVPDKVHDDLVFYSKQTDKVPFISAYVVNGWPGGDLLVDVVDDGTYIPKEFSSGGKLSTETIETVQATISPISFGISPRITNDLIEDAHPNFEMVDYHIRRAALAMGQKATSLAITVLGTATDGVGTVNSGASGDAGETKWMGASTTGISEAIDANLVDHWVSNTIVTSGEPWSNSISETLPVGSTYLPVAEGFTHCINNMDVLLHNDVADLTNGSSKLETIVFDRNNALLTGRKRWLQINNYSDPTRDLAACTITARQDSVTLFDDAICVIAET